MNLPQFPTDPSCTECDLHEGVQSVCVPTVFHADSVPDARHAFVFIAQNPGHNEDQTNTPLIGKSGQYVRRVLCSPSFGEGIPPLNKLATVYFTNAARCTTPQETPPKSSQYKKCASLYLWPDLDLIRSRHEHTILFCLGRPAAAYTWEYLTGKKGSSSVASYTKVNGTQFHDSTVTFVSTYHPSAFLRERSYHESIVNHMMIAINTILGRRVKQSKPNIVKPFAPEST